MTEGEALQFERDPLFNLSIRMRQWDELAKETQVPIISLADLKEKAKKILKKDATD